MTVAPINIQEHAAQFTAHPDINGSWTSKYVSKKQKPVREEPKSDIVTSDIKNKLIIFEGDLKKIPPEADYATEIFNLCSAAGLTKNQVRDIIRNAPDTDLILESLNTSLSKKSLAELTQDDVQSIVEAFERTDRLSALFNAFAAAGKTDQDMNFVIKTLEAKAIAYPDIIPQVFAESIKKRFDDQKDIMPLLTALEFLSSHRRKNSDPEPSISDTGKLFSNKTILDILDTALNNDSDGYGERITNMLVYNLKHAERWDPTHTITPSQKIVYHREKIVPEDGLTVNVLKEAADGLAQLAERFLQQQNKTIQRQTPRGMAIS